MALMLPPGAKLVAATHNPGKARELSELLSGRFEVVSAGSLGLPEPEETGTTFAANAELKALAAAKAANLPALADDSGLVVDALNGDPGIYSARWAGPERDFGQAMGKLEARLEATGSDDRSAWFTCALAVAWPGGPAVVVEGRVDGVLTFPGRGTLGFGYDPIFAPEGHEATFGEMTQGLKDSLSHRTRAFEMLRAALF